MSISHEDAWSREDRPVEKAAESPKEKQHDDGDSDVQGGIRCPSFGRRVAGGTRRARCIVRRTCPGVARRRSTFKPTYRTHNIRTHADAPESITAELSESEVTAAVAAAVAVSAAVASVAVIKGSSELAPVAAAPVSVGGRSVSPATPL